MLRPTYKPYWDIPGGYIEESESPLSACIREVREELGIEVGVRSLLAVDWAPNADEGDKMLFVFDGGSLSPDQLHSIRFADGEIGEYAFVDASQLDQITLPRLARRIREALRARQDTRTAYLQDGSTPGW